MDLNNDGNLDILSGSYSRMEGDMAGLFQVLWGVADHGFKKAEALSGTDNKPLILPGNEESITDKICTRPTAVDINGDGHLDLVVGNFAGTFFVFYGEGKARFNPTPVILQDKEGTPLAVNAHSDPFLVDWDGDADLDLLSGSAEGGVYLSINKGSKTEPLFSQLTEVYPPVESHYAEIVLGDAHIRGPQASTRVYVADLNQDGRLDLLVGDGASIVRPAKGVNKDEIKALLDSWQEKQQKLAERMMKIQTVIQEHPDAESNEGKTAQKEYEALDEEFARLWDDRGKIVEEEMTGFVWVLYRK